MPINVLQKSRNRIFSFYFTVKTNSFKVLLSFQTFEIEIKNLFLIKILEFLFQTFSLQIFFSCKAYY